MAHRIFRIAVPAAAGAALLATLAAPAQATIHPLVQSIACAADAARANVAVADPPGQTPEGFTTELPAPEGSLLIISFPEPLEFTQSDFRAVIATGVVDEVRTDADGNVTAVVVDLTTLPQATSGEGFAHCANG